MTRNGDHMWTHQIKGGNSVYINSLFIDGMRKAHIAGGFLDVVQFSDDHTLDSHLMKKEFSAGDAYIMRMK